MHMSLLCTIAHRGGQIWFSRDGEWLENMLADHFGLTREQREYADPRWYRSKGSRAWRNDIQWVRKQLVDDGLIDNSVRDLWKLTDAGWRAIGVVRTDA